MKCQPYEHNTDSQYKLLENPYDYRKQTKDYVHRLDTKTNKVRDLIK